MNEFKHVTPEEIEALAKFLHVTVGYLKLNISLIK